MIKKSIFEDDLIRGMQNELFKQASDIDMQNLSSAVDYLNSAAQILEEAGMIEASNKIIDMLFKVATLNNKYAGWGDKSFPAMEVFMSHGLNPKDLAHLPTNPLIRAKVIKILRDLKYTDENIVKLLGIKNYFSLKQVDDILNNLREMLDGDILARAKINKLLRNANKNSIEIINLIGKNNFMTQNEIEDALHPTSVRSVEKLYRTQEPAIIGTPGQFIHMTDEQYIDPDELLATAMEKRPKDPTKISDRHTKGLTSEKMVNNLKHHGTVFNMADDGSFDILDADIDDNLTVSEDALTPIINDFEDEID